MVRTTVFLADPNQLVRDGLRRLLEVETYAVVGEAPRLTLSAVLACDADIDLIVFDVDERMAGEFPGIIERIRRRRPHSKFVVLNDDASPVAVTNAAIWGVDGYLSKDISAAAFVMSLKLIALGQQVFPPHATTVLTRPLPADRPQRGDLDMAALSARELEVLSALVRGRSNKAIARELSISATTVKVHLQALLRKIRQTNRTQAAVWAISHGLGATAPADERVDVPFAAIAAPALASQACESAAATLALPRARKAPSPAQLLP
jgi:two-component system, NarL family, nitrate/nitrite response regulator NarL